MHRLNKAAAAVLFIAFVCVLCAACDNTLLAREPIEGPPEHTLPPLETPTPEPLPSVLATAVPVPTPVPTPEMTPPPTPEPTPMHFEEGMIDPAVRDLQRRLMELGYLPLSEDQLTDKYGPATKQAVEAFQRQNGLDVDGVAGESTLAAIFAPDAPQAVRLPLSGITIGLDPGHQAHGNNEQEAVAPGSSETKPKVSSGTAGVSSGVSEYVVNLAVGLKLRDILEDLGANVLMTRESNDVNISNAERAQMMNSAGVDLVVRLHCDGEDDASRNGAFILIPVGPYAAEIEGASRSAAEAVLSAFVAETGARNLGLSERDDQTGFNWSTVPVINIEMGHMSNPAEDERLVSDSYQQLCAQGIANGLVDYFS